MRTAARRRRAALPGRRLRLRFPGRRCRYPPGRQPASPGTRVDLLQTAARPAAAHRTRPTRPHLAACVLPVLLPSSVILGVPVLETGAATVRSSRFVTTREDLLVAAGPSVG